MPITVKELIKHLKTLPQDYQVLYCLHSDYAVLDLEEIEVQHSTDKLNYGTAILHHNMPGEYRSYGGDREYKGQKLPTPASVVIFPGN